jgi:hypothetical protein
LRLLVSFPGSSTVREQLMKEAGLPDTSCCARRANELKIFDDADKVIEAVKLLMAVGEFDEAADLGCSIIPGKFKEQKGCCFLMMYEFAEILQPQRKWNPEEALKVIELIQETGIVSDKIRLLSAYVGTLFAIRRGYYKIVQPLIENVV